MVGLFIQQTLAEGSSGQALWLVLQPQQEAAEDPVQAVGSDEARWPQKANVTGDGGRGSSRDPPSWVSSDMGCGLHASRRTLAYWFQIDIIL